MNHSSIPSTSPNTTGAVTLPHNQSALDHAPVPSADLLRGRKAVAIAHNGMLYMLQSTKLGKLILTK